MNKATNLQEFRAAIEMHAFAGLNIIYADKDDNIFYVDNAQFPRRNKNYDWWHVLPGDTSATLWKPNDYYPYDSLFQLLNPPCGWLHNNNHTPFFSTLKGQNIDRATHPMKDYYFRYLDNRGIRTNYLFSNTGKISYEEFKQIKYDQSFMKPIYTYAMSNIETIFTLDENKYPQIKEALAAIKKWNREADADNEQAAIAALTIHYMKEILFKNGMFPAVRTKFSEQTMVNCIEKAQKHLKKYFGKIEIPLGEMQRLVRGDKTLPLSGMPDVNAAMDLAEYKKGRFKGISGESYIEIVQFTKDGALIETIQPYGQSNKKGNPHYDDQMELSTQHKLKKMTMDYDELMANNERVYHPG
jgi:acyl-homoserine-lactone acylase